MASEHWTSSPLYDDLKKDHPGRWKRALNGSRVALDELHCIHCTGVGKSSRAARQCENQVCLLWSRTFNREKVRTNALVESDGLEVSGET